MKKATMTDGPHLHGPICRWRDYSRRNIVTWRPGGCMRCAAPWCDGNNAHSTPYSRWASCFPLCNACWALLSPEMRLPYYAMLFAVWCGQSPNDIDELFAETWPAIKVAVLAGG